MDSLPFLFAVLLLMPGLALAFIPVVPAILYMFVVALGFAVLTKFSSISGWELTILSAVTVISVAVDQLSGVLGAKWGGAGRRAMLFGLIGAIGGAILGGPLMSFVGLFTGIFVTEIFQLRPHLEAFRAASGGVIGALIGYTINIVLVVVFFALFIFFGLR